MKKIFIILGILLTLILSSSCGNNDDDNGRQAQQEKNLFSSWVETTNGFNLDLRRLTFGQASAFDVLFEAGEICSCNILLSGNQSAGVLRINNCFYAGGGGGVDPGCDEFENNGAPYAYTKSNDILRLCSTPNECGVYR